MDLIEIENLRLRTQLGFSQHEIGKIQDIVLSLMLKIDCQKSAANDVPEEALNYRTVTKFLIAYIENSCFNLVEKLAEDIAAICIVAFKIPWVRVKLHKPHALRFADSVGVVIERSASHFPQPFVFLSLGANINPEQHLQSIVNRLKQCTTLVKMSQIFKTPAIGNENDDPFLNMAVIIITKMNPNDLKTKLRSIEHELGRVRNKQDKNAPITIDIDITLWGDTCIEYEVQPTENIQSPKKYYLPDKDILKYCHVAVPVGDLAPDMKHPITGESFKDIAEKMSKGLKEKFEIVSQPWNKNSMDINFWNLF